MSVGNKLVGPRLLPSQVMDVVTLHQVYNQKVVYLRPSKRLLRNNQTSAATFHDINMSIHFISACSM